MATSSPGSLGLAVDYSFSPPSVASLVAAGVRSVGRYVGAGTEPKQLHAAERDALFAAGIDIFLLVEGASDSALGGAPVGRYHAQLALLDCAELSVPRGGARPISLVGNCDFQVTEAQWPAVRNYMIEYGRIIRPAGFRVGFYGGRRAIEWAMRDGLAEVFFQTYAWSDLNHDGTPEWVPGTHLRQYRNRVPIGGGDGDLCDIMIGDYGQWEAVGKPTSPPGSESEMYAFKTPASSAVWLSDGVSRRSAEWVSFQRLVEAGLVKRPASAAGPLPPTDANGLPADGTHVDGQNASAYVLVVPASTEDAYGGPIADKGGSAVLVAHTHDVAGSGEVTVPVNLNGTTGPAVPSA